MIIIVFSCWRVLVRGRLFQATSVLCALWHGPSKQRIRRGCKPRHTKDDRSHRHPKHKNQSQNTHTLNSAKAKKQTRTPKGLQLQYVCSVPGTKKLLCFVCSTRSRPPSGSKTHARRACPDSLANSENPVCTAVWGTNERTNRQKRRKQTNTAKHITRQHNTIATTTTTTTTTQAINIKENKTNKASVLTPNLNKTHQNKTKRNTHTHKHNITTHIKA